MTAAIVAYVIVGLAVWVEGRWTGRPYAEALTVVGTTLLWPLLVLMALALVVVEENIGNRIEWAGVRWRERRKERMLGEREASHD